MSEAARPNKCLHLPDALMRASKPETLTAEEAIMSTIDKALREKGNVACNQMFEEFEKINREYWSALNDLQNADYRVANMAMDDIRRVSLLGLALVACNDAHSAMNRVRCI